jgi:hypothetical protein
VRFKRGRRSLREHLKDSHAGQSFYAAMAGKPPPVPARLLEMGPKRTRAPSDPADSEGPVLAAVGELLAVHPLVALAVRQNSGALGYESKGRFVPVWFYKLCRRPGAGEITLTDYWGFLKDGRPFALECKRPSWRAPREPRELNQQAFIHLIESFGGIGGFVRSSDEAKALLG